LPPFSIDFFRTAAIARGFFQPPGQDLLSAAASFSISPDLPANRDWRPSAHQANIVNVRQLLGNGSAFRSRDVVQGGGGDGFER